MYLYVYKAIWDQEFKVYYYWNHQTGESSWYKPARQTFNRTGRTSSSSSN